MFACLSHQNEEKVLFWRNKIVDETLYLKEQKINCDDYEDN